MKQPTDGTDELIDRLRARSRSAYAEALRRYGGFVSSIAGMMVRDRRDAEEVVQDTFIGAFRDIGAYNGAEASFATWLGRIAWHRSVEMLRRRRIPVGELSDEAAAIADDAHDEEPEADIDELREALALLAPAERTLLTLVYFDDLPLARVAYIMQSNPSALSARLYRLRNKLARIINERKKRHT